MLIQLGHLPDALDFLHPHICSRRSTCSLRQGFVAAFNLLTEQHADFFGGILLRCLLRRYRHNGYGA